MSSTKDRKGKGHSQMTFKPNVQNQGWLFPPTPREVVLGAYLARLPNSAIDGSDIEPVLTAYEGGGSSGYHPRMMPKLSVYDHVEKKYPSRDIAKAARGDTCFM